MDEFYKEDISFKFKKKKRRVENTVFYPFSAGIPWLRKGSTIQPEIKAHIWDSVVLSKKDFIAVSFGGLLESFLSLICLESLSSNVFDHGFYWIGNKNYKQLIKFQGLVKVSNIKLTEQHLTKYQVPLFFDANDNVYFNLLHNYKSISHRRYSSRPNKKPIIQQVTDNTFFPFSKVQLRKLETIKEKKKQILILPDRGFSIHNEVCFSSWSIQHFKELSAMLYGKNYDIVVATKDSQKFMGTKIKTIKPTLEEILKVLTHCSIILSSEVDWLIVAMLLNKKAVIIGNTPENKCFDFFGNADFIDATNMIHATRKAIYPIDVFQMCENL